MFPPARRARPGALKITPSSAGPLIRAFLWRHRWRYGTGFLLLAATNLLALALPRLLKLSVEALQASDGRRLGLLTLALVAAAIAQAVVRTASRLTILGASRYVAAELRDRLFTHMLQLPLTWYARRRIGDIASRAVNDMILVRSFFGPGLLNLVNTGLVYITTLSMMAAIDLRLTLWAVAPYPLFLLAVNRLSRRIYGQSIAVQEQTGALSARAQETFAGITLVKTNAREEPEAAAWTVDSAEALRRSLVLAKTRAGMIPLMGLMTSAGTLVVVSIGGREVIAGRLGLGDFVAFNTCLAFLVWPTFAFGWILNTFQRGAAALRRISEVMDAPAESREIPSGSDLTPLVGHILVKGLTFAHDGAPSGHTHLKEIDVEIPAGTTLGILGTTGSGKSTLIGLLVRLNTPPEGTIFVDGLEINSIPLGRLRRDIALIPQEAFLFSRTLRENLTLGATDASADALAAALEDSRLARDLSHFPAGLDTLVGERGVTLSGGQRQRAALARTLLCDTPVLILDDTLSSLDAQVESEAVARIRKTREGRTTIIVSHRVAPLAHAREILVMDQGRIVERGTHAFLLHNGGLYAEIARRQMLSDRIEQEP